MAAGSLDTVTIFGPGDFATRGDPLGTGNTGVTLAPIGLAAPTDLRRGDIAVVWGPAWLLWEEAACRVDTS